MKGRIFATCPSWYMSGLLPGPHPTSGGGSREELRQGPDPRHSGASQRWDFTTQNDPQPAGGVEGGVQGGRGKIRVQHPLDGTADSCDFHTF